MSYFSWANSIQDAASTSHRGYNLFCDESHKVSVDGSDAIYYALSRDEWKYLFNNHSKKWAKVNGMNGYVIAPDGFAGSLSDSYPDDAALAADKLVSFPLQATAITRPSSTSSIMATIGRPPCTLL